MSGNDQCKKYLVQVLVFKHFSVTHFLVDMWMLTHTYKPVGMCSVTRSQVNYKHTCGTCFHGISMIFEAP